MEENDQYRALLFQILNEDDTVQDEADRIASEYVDVVEFREMSTKYGLASDSLVDHNIRSLESGTLKAELPQVNLLLKKSYTRASTIKRKPENAILENFLKDIGIDDECSDIDDQVYLEQVNKMLEKDMNQDALNTELDKRLNITFDDDSDNEISVLFKKNTDANDEQQTEQERLKLQEKVSQMNLLEVIELNEKNDDERFKDSYQNTFSVFSHDKNYYRIHNIDKRLMDYNILTKISDNVYKPILSEFSGVP